MVQKSNSIHESSQGDGSNVTPEDLSLVDSLEDEVADPAALWAEFDAAEGEQPGDAVSDDDDSLPPEDDDDGREPDADESDTAEDWSETEQPDGDDEPDSAAQADTDKQSDGDGPSDDEKSSDDADRQNVQEEDIWANATPAQRAAWQAAQQQLRKLEQADRSNRGRLSALQRQLNELLAGQRQSGAAPSGAANQGAHGAGQAGADGKSDGADYLASNEWKQFADEYPEVAGPLEKIIGSLQEKVVRQEKFLSAIGEERQQAALEEQARLLTEEHPDWQDVTADPEFGPWLMRQPRHIREAAERNAKAIVDYQEAADVVGRFKQYRELHKQGGIAHPSNARSGARSSEGRESSNHRLSAKRQRQLEAATSARTRSPAVVNGIAEDGDPETIWRQWDEYERRQARRARA